MEIRQRLKSNSGFSLAETLVATLILLLVSLLLANGMPTVKAVYERVTIGANARVLLSTTVATLRNELGTAKDVIVNGTAVNYYSIDTHTTSSIYLDNKSIMLNEYTDTAFGDKSPERKLMTDSAANKDLYVTFDSITQNNALIVFNQLRVCRKSNDDVMAGPIDLSVRTIIGPVGR